MIRLIQRRLIVPRGDTGTFSIPVLAGKDTGDVSIFTVFDPLMHKKIFEKVMTLSGEMLTMELTHGDTVNLPVGQYVWDIKFYTNPIFAEEKLIGGTEVDSYYAAFTLPACEIRETGDNLLMSDDAPTGALKPGQIDFVTASINEITSLKNTTTIRAAEADTSAQNAANSAQNASVSAQEALSSQNAAQAAAQQATASAELATTKANQIEADITNKADKSEIPTLVSQLENDSGYLTQETDPTVPSWAKAAQKPTYTAQEVGALSNTTYIPNKVSDLQNDVGYLTEHQDISMKANSADLATVATSGSYNDLLNKPFIPSAVSDLIDDSGYYTKPANGIPATDMTSGVQTSLGLADTAYQKPNNGIPASDLASGVIPSVPVQDVQIKNTSILNNGVANIPLAANGAVGLVQGNNTYGTAITAAGDIMIYRADDSAIKNGNGEYKPIVPYTEHQAVFYGLAKAAGDTTQRDSQNNVGIYTSSAQSAIQAMLGVPSTSSVASSIASAIRNVHSFDVEVIQSLPTQNIKEHTIYFIPKTGDTNDVYDEYIYVNNAWEMIGNTQIDFSNYVQKTDYASSSDFGIIKVPLAGGLFAENGGIYINSATQAHTKAGTQGFYPVTPARQHESTFYGLAKAAGDTTQSVSTNAVGTYTTEAKTAIQGMLGIMDINQIAVVVGTGAGSAKTKDFEYNGTTYTQIASGIGAYAFGFNNTASGNGAFVEGSANVASGGGSHAEGNGNTAAGSMSHCEGYMTRANGRLSHVEGNNTTTTHACQHVHGEYNVTDPSTNTSTERGTYIDITGNGISGSARSNAYALEWTGTGRYMGDVYVGCNNDSTGGTRLATITEVAAKLDAAEAGLKVVRLI